MKRGLVWTAVTFVSVSLLAVAARGETAPQAFAAGKSALAKADFPEALRAFSRAVHADRDNQEYIQNYAMVRQVIMLRRQLAAEKDAARWEYIARGLHAFYVENALHGEALALDRKIHARLGNTSSAVMLAETQLALNMDAEAAETLAALPSAKQTASTQSLHGLALARQGQLEEAKRMAATVDVPAEAGPGVTYCAARLNAAVGNDEQALVLLTRCFESVAPSRLDRFKQHARQSPEFVSLASTPTFAQVMETESKVAESKCSGGSRCAGCPMRGKCSKGEQK
jgi:tetratricopeptide (TPR) repeat protein